VLVSTSSFARYDISPIKTLESRGYDVVLNPYGRTLKSDELISLASECVGIVAGTEKYGKEVIEKLPKLKVISRCGTGLDSIDSNAANSHSISIRNTPEAPTQAVAELTVGLILDISRKISLMDRNIRNGKWNKKMGQLLSGKTIGIVGLGRIGLRVAEILNSFNVLIIGYDLSPKMSFLKKTEIQLVTMEKLLKKSDIITIHIPYSAEAYHFIDVERLKSMKKGAILINTSRGGIVDEEALYAYLKNGHLSGAAIDTFEKEPYGGPLKELNNIVLTPHIGSYAKEARIEMEMQAVENLIEALNK
jgi:D-3-phosphoglycerate dehydrogenase